MGLESRIDNGSVDGLALRPAIDPGSVLVYIQNNAGSGEQIAREAETETATLTPVLRELIEAGEVKAWGKARGTRYAAG